MEGISRRGFLKGSLVGVCLSFFNPFQRVAKGQTNPSSPLFWIEDIPVQSFYPSEDSNHHAGLDALLQLMGENGLKFYRSAQEVPLSGPSGMIEFDDVVLIKVNAQWKYRGCTNSDLIRGLIQAILEHPDGFTGEVVIFDNDQGRGSSIAIRVRAIRMALSMPTPTTKTRVSFIWSTPFSRTPGFPRICSILSGVSSLAPTIT